jgi:hypothetical protein
MNVGISIVVCLPRCVAMVSTSLPLSLVLSPMEHNNSRSCHLSLGGGGAFLSIVVCVIVCVH